MAIDYTGFLFPKGQTRRDRKIEDKAAAKIEDDAARAKAWKRCKGRCEDCGKRVSRSGDLITGAHFDHDPPRSLAPGAPPRYRVTCFDCHYPGPSGAHKRHSRKRSRC